MNQGMYFILIYKSQRGYYNADVLKESQKFDWDTRVHIAQGQLNQDVSNIKIFLWGIMIENKGMNYLENSEDSGYQVFKYCF